MRLGGDGSWCYLILSVKTQACAKILAVVRKLRLPLKSTPHALKAQYSVNVRNRCSNARCRSNPSTFWAHRKSRTEDSPGSYDRQAQLFQICSAGTEA